MAALDGVKILDLMWVMAGPAGTRILADYGATVVRVESTKRIDTARTLAPFFGGSIGTEQSGCFQNLNLGKRLLTLDPANPAGREVFLDLVRWADVVTESFKPGTMAKWNLGWDALRAAKPDLIMLSSCLMGQSGPLASFAGYGNLAAAISGFSNLGGWPDRPPAGPFSAYTDYVAPRYIAIAILAALDHKRRTGEGQYIDLSQAEASLHFLGPALLDYTVNGRVAGRLGNRDRDIAPNGVYPAAGDDRWVAISATTDAQWSALCTAIGRDDLRTDPALANASGRLAAQDALDAAIAAWTASRDMHDVEHELQAVGVPAHAVQNSRELLVDAQLLHRGHFVEVTHPEREGVTLEGTRFHLSRTPAEIESSAPTYGRDNEWVLKDLLGYDDDRVTELVVAGALE